MQGIQVLSQDTNLKQVLTDPLLAMQVYKY